MQKEGKLILKIESDLIASNVRGIMEEAKVLINQPGDFFEIVVDIGIVRVMDSMGISFLVGLYKTASSNGKSFVVVGANDDMKKLFKLMKLDEVFAT